MKRVISLPDGATHIIDVDEWYWDTIDHLEAIGWRSLEDLIESAWSAFLYNQAHDLPGTLPQLLVYGIFEANEQYEYRVNGYANDNCLQSRFAL